MTDVAIVRSPDGLVARFKVLADQTRLVLVLALLKVARRRARRYTCWAVGILRNCT